MWASTPEAQQILKAAIIGLVLQSRKERHEAVRLLADYEASSAPLVVTVLTDTYASLTQLIPEQNAQVVSLVSQICNELSASLTVDELSVLLLSALRAIWRRKGSDMKPQPAMRIIESVMSTLFRKNIPAGPGERSQLLELAFVLVRFSFPGHWPEMVAIVMHLFKNVVAVAMGTTDMDPEELIAKLKFLRDIVSVQISKRLGNARREMQSWVFNDGVLVYAMMIYVAAEREAFSVLKSAEFKETAKTLACGICLELLAFTRNVDQLLDPLSEEYKRMTSVVNALGPRGDQAWGQLLTEAASLWKASLVAASNAAMGTPCMSLQRAREIWRLQSDLMSCTGIFGIHSDQSCLKFSIDLDTHLIGPLRCEDPQKYPKMDADVMLFQLNTLASVFEQFCWSSSLPTSLETIHPRLSSEKLCSSGQNTPRAKPVDFEAYWNQICQRSPAEVLELGFLMGSKVDAMENRDIENDTDNPGGLDEALYDLWTEILVRSKYGYFAMFRLTDLLMSPIRRPPQWVLFKMLGCVFGSDDLSNPLPYTDGESEFTNTTATPEFVVSDDGIRVRQRLKEMGRMMPTWCDQCEARWEDLMAFLDLCRAISTNPYLHDEDIAACLDDTLCQCISKVLLRVSSNRVQCPDPGQLAVGCTLVLNEHGKFYTIEAAMGLHGLLTQTESREAVPKIVECLGDTLRMIVSASLTGDLSLARGRTLADVILKDGLAVLKALIPQWHRFNTGLVSSAVVAINYYCYILLVYGHPDLQHIISTSLCPVILDSAMLFTQFLTSSQKRVCAVSNSTVRLSMDSTFDPSPTGLQLSPGSQPNADPIEVGEEEARLGVLVLAASLQLLNLVVKYFGKEKVGFILKSSNLLETLDNCLISNLLLSPSTVESRELLQPIICVFTEIAIACKGDEQVLTYVAKRSKDLLIWMFKDGVFARGKDECAIQFVRLWMVIPAPEMQSDEFATLCCPAIRQYCAARVKAGLVDATNWTRMGVDGQVVVRDWSSLPLNWYSLCANNEDMKTAVMSRKAAHRTSGEGGWGEIELKIFLTQCGIKLGVGCPSLCASKPSPAPIVLAMLQS